MGKVLLFNVNIIKGAQILGVCNGLGHEVVRIPKGDYDKSMGELAGITGLGNAAVRNSAARKNNVAGAGGNVGLLTEFPDEMMVFSGIDSDELDKFLDAYRGAGIAPIVRKAVLTPVNVKWSARALYKDLSEHVQ